jgi:predicted N-acetyltransferase YhbS
MNLSFSIATPADAPALAALHTSVAEDLTRRHGQGFWSTKTSEKGALLGIRTTRVVVARTDKTIVGTLRLQTKKPWAIDVSYFTRVEKAIYLTSMAVVPSMQRHGIGRSLLAEAKKQVEAWPADAIRLDAFDTDAGDGEFYAKCGFCEKGRVVYRKNPLIYFECVVL